MLFAIVIFVVCLYLYCRLTCGRTESDACLVGKTALVTGGNDGIGFQVCLNLASRGCKVIIADKNDSELSRKKIIDQTNNPNIISKKFDLASFKSVRNLAKDINETESRLDILINNAGVGALPDAITEDGLNTLLQINHFGGFLLTHLLMGLLKKNAPSRIIFTASPIVFISNCNPEDFQRTKFGDTTYATYLTYGNTKLAAIVTAEVLAEKLRGSGITANSISPGWVRTGLWERTSVEVGWLAWFILKILLVWCYVVGKSVWEGAQTTTHVAVSKDLEKVSGKFFSDCCDIAKPPQSRGELYWPLSMLGNKYEDKKESFGQKIWRISEESCKLQLEERI